MIQWSSVFKAQRSTYFQILCLCLGKVLQHPECNEAWKSRVAGVRAERNYRDFEDVSGESTEFEWNIFPGFTSLQLCDKISNLLSSWGQSPETLPGRILFMSMFNDICDRYDNKNWMFKECRICEGRLQKDLELVNGLSLDQVLRKSGILPKNSPQGAWDHVAEDMLLKFAESGHPIFRATTPLSRGKLKSKGKGKVVHTLQCWSRYSWYNLSHYSFCQSAQYLRSSGSYMRWVWRPSRQHGATRYTGGSVNCSWRNQSRSTCSHDEEPRDAQIILQQYFQQVKSLSPENRLSKFCKEAGFMSVVEVGQYFVTRNASEFQQYDSLSRIHPSSRRPSFSTKRGGSEENTRIGPILEVTTSFQHFKYGIEVRIQSVNEDNSHSWVRISYGTVRYVDDYIKYDTQNFADPQEEEDVPNKLRSGCSQVKGKSKTSTEGIYWHDDHPTKWKSMDWHWTIKARSRVVQSLEERHQSSSTHSEVTSRRRWSNSILQNQVPSTRLSSSNTKLVRWSMG